MLFCVVWRYAQPKMLAFDGCLVQAMDCTFVHTLLFLFQSAIGSFKQISMAASPALAQKNSPAVPSSRSSENDFLSALQKMYVCILPVQGSHPCLHKAIMCMPAQGNQTTIQCLNKALTICFFEMGGVIVLEQSIDHLLFLK